MSVSRRRFLQLLAAAPLAVACDGRGRLDADRRSLPPLKAAFAPYFLVGAALEPAQLDDAPDVELLTKNFSSITAENVMKPRVLAPDGPGQHAFDDADRIVRFAAEHGLAVRGHTLVWHRTAPKWFFAGDRARLTSVTTWGLSDNHTWLTRFPVARRNLPLMFDTSRAAKWSWNAA